MNRFTYLLKQGLFCFVYLVITMLTAAFIGVIDENLAWLKIILWILNIALYGAIAFFFARSQGEKEKKLEYSNDVERRHVAETGDFVNINAREEYKPLNGFFTGLVICIPLFALYLIFAVFTLANVEQNTVVVITNLLYGTFTLPLGIVETIGTDPVTSIIHPARYFFSLYGAVIVCAVMSLGHWVGAQRIVKQHKKIENIQTQIYGEKK